MRDVIISHSRQKDTIVLEGEYEFPVYITIGLHKGNDFYVGLEFTDLNEENLLILAKLANEPKALSITSELIKHENYNIQHIVVEKFFASNLLEMTWECLSDRIFSLELD